MIILIDVIAVICWLYYIPGFIRRLCTDFMKWYKVKFKKYLESFEIISASKTHHRAIDNLVSRKAVIDHLMITTIWHDEDLITVKSDHCPICKENIRGE